MKRKVLNPRREPIEVAAVIPARGGKQSIPYKNLQKLGGKTLLAWAVEVALMAEKIDVVLVSTEDKRIAREASRLGAIVIPRPKKYSLPNSGDAGFYHHAVKWMEKDHGWKPELLVNLRPTSPLRFPKDIDNMVEHMRESKADGLKSVIPTPLHPYKMWEMGGNGKLKPVFDNAFRQEQGPDQPRQKIQDKFPVYFQDGQIDITRRKFILRPECLKYDNVWGENLHGYVLDPRTSTDLDEPADFRRAAKLYKQMQKETKRAA
ncbi:MAG: acylneuraminate cytidylyltransferase family protein [bacterium]